MSKFGLYMGAGDDDEKQKEVLATWNPYVDAVLGPMENKIKEKDWKFASGNKARPADFQIAAFYYRFVENKNAKPRQEIYNYFTKKFEYYPLLKGIAVNMLKNPGMARHIKSRFPAPW